MPPPAAESTAPMPLPPAARPALSRGTLVAVGLWACVFALFVFLGLQS